MYRIEKFALFAGIAGLLLPVLGPSILRSEMDKRKGVAGGVKALGPAFLKVQQDKGNAILWARPMRDRGYKISLDGKYDYEWVLARTKGLRFRENPVPVPVKKGSRFHFQYRHSGYQYRVTNINGKGVSIEVGGDRGALFFRNQTVFLPWK